MYKIICAKFHYKNWINHNAVIAYIDSLQKRYGFDQSIKELFYQLKDVGYCETCVFERRAFINQILRNEKISFQEIKDGINSFEKNHVCI